MRPRERAYYEHGFRSRLSGAFDGWRILDAQDKAERITGQIPIGEARTFALSGKNAQLSNKGGTISLLDARGLKVDGVAYTKADAQREGAGLAF